MPFFGWSYKAEPVEVDGNGTFENGPDSNLGTELQTLDASTCESADSQKLAYCLIICGFSLIGMFTDE
jgi:hypothetical protein